MDKQKVSTVTVSSNIVEEKIKDDLEKLDERTFLFRNEAKQMDIYVLAYSRFSLSLVVLKNLKDAGQWNVIKHPYIFNYLNEILKHFAFMHMQYILAHLFYLFLVFLATIHKPTALDLFFITVMIFGFLFILLVQATLKHEREYTYGKFFRCYCFWIASGFAFVTYVITFVFFWFPTVVQFLTPTNTIKTTFNLLALLSLISSVILVLQILRNSPIGIYVIIISKMIKHVLKIALLWGLLLLCFAYSFYIVNNSSNSAMDPYTNSSAPKEPIEIVTAFLSLGNDAQEHRPFERILFTVFQITTVAVIIALAISRDFRTEAEKEYLRIKTNFCIKALHFSLKTDVIPDQTPFYRQQINNVLVVDKATGRCFSSYINLTKLKVLKMTATKETPRKRVRFPSITDIPTDFLKNAERIDFSPNQDLMFIQELENIRDTEGIIQKIKRWFDCLDWKTHLYPANPKFYIIPRKIPV